MKVNLPDYNIFHKNLVTFAVNKNPHHDKDKY